MVVSISSWERNDHAVSFMQLGTFTLKTSPSSPEITVVLDGNRTNCNWPKNPCNTINRQSYFFPHPVQTTTERTKQIFFITVYRLFEASSAVVSTREMTNKENTNAKQILSHNSFSNGSSNSSSTVSHACHSVTPCAQCTSFAYYKRVERMATHPNGMLIKSYKSKWHERKLVLLLLLGTSELPGLPTDDKCRQQIVLSTSKQHKLHKYTVYMSVCGMRVACVRIVWSTRIYTKRIWNSRWWWCFARRWHQMTLTGVLDMSLSAIKIHQI